MRSEYFHMTTTGDFYVFKKVGIPFFTSEAAVLSVFQKNWNTVFYFRSSRSQCFSKKLEYRFLLQKQPFSVLFKLAVRRPATLLKRDSKTRIFLWMLQIFKNDFFYRTPLVAASVRWKYYEWKSNISIQNCPAKSYC